MEVNKSALYSAITEHLGSEAHSLFTLCENLTLALAAGDLNRHEVKTALARLSVEIERIEHTHYSLSETRKAECQRLAEVLGKVSPYLVPETGFNNMPEASGKPQGETMTIDELKDENASLKRINERFLCEMAQMGEMLGDDGSGHVPTLLKEHLDIKKEISRSTPNLLCEAWHNGKTLTLQMNADYLKNAFAMGVTTGCSASVTDEHEMLEHFTRAFNNSDNDTPFGGFIDSVCEDAIESGESFLDVEDDCE